MNLDACVLIKLTRAFQPKAYTRIFPSAFSGTPLGTGPGNSRFSSLKGDFTTFYAARSLATAIAETIIRDRFEGGGARILFSPELTSLSAVSISSTAPLQLIDLRKDGCFQLGISTDIASAKGWTEARELAQHIHDTTTLDGILYHSRLTGENCIAVFNRAVQVNLSAGKVVNLTSNPGLSAAFNTLNTALIL